MVKSLKQGVEKARRNKIAMTACVTDYLRLACIHVIH